MSLFVNIFISLAALSSPFVNGRNKLVVVIRKGENRAVDDVKRLIREDEEIVNKPHGDGTLPLEAAITARNAEIAAILINNEVNINAQFKDGSYALHRVIENDLEPTLKSLLSEGVDLTKRVRGNPLGATCLHLAVVCKRFSMLNRLLEELANRNLREIVNTRNKESLQRTALHEAVVRLDDKEGAAYVKVLLEAKAYVGSQDQDVRTPLHYAARANKVEMTHLLLEYGAVYWDEDVDKNTPFKLAAANNSDEAALILMNAEVDHKVVYKYKRRATVAAAPSTTDEKPSENRGSFRSAWSSLVPNFFRYRNKITE